MRPQHNSNEIVEALTRIEAEFKARCEGQREAHRTFVPIVPTENAQHPNTLQGLAQFDRKLEQAVTEINVITREHEHMSANTLRDKLANASKVVGRVVARIEGRADGLLAREKELETQTERAFAPHEALLDQAKQGLDETEAALRLLSNAPLDGSTNG